MWWGKSKQADASNNAQLPESAHASQLSRPQPLISALEPRMMFDGAIAATVASDIPNADDAADNTHGDVASAETSQDASDSSHAGLVSDTQGGGRKEIVFVDTRVPDYQALLQSVSPDAEVVLLSTDQNGVQQIADALAGRSGIDAIHIISHGDAGVLLLGNAPLFEGNLGDYSSQLQSIGEALTTDGDILLYGCEVGAGNEGQAFLSQLSIITGADIAASDDGTGGSAKGADWDLEITTGDVAASYALNLSQLGSYDHVLVTTSVNSVAGLKAAIATGNTDGVDDVITLTGNITFASAADAISINVTDGQTMSIVGGGFTLSGNNLARVLDVSTSGAGSEVAISNLTISNGFLTGAGGNTPGNAAGLAGGDALGANIRNAGTLTITGSTITAGKAAGGGGGGGGQGGGGGAGGGGGGFGTTYGGAGGTNPTHTPGSASAGTGGDGAGFGNLVGRGGSSSGGAGATYGNSYTDGGSGGTASNGSISIGGGGGGGGYSFAGGRGGNATGGIYNTGILTITTSTITNNIAAGGGGGGGGASGISGNGGDAGSGIGAIWNAGGTVQIDAATNTSLATGNVGAAGGIGVTNDGGSVNGAAGASTSQIRTTGGGTTDTNYNPNATPTIGSLNGDSVAWAGIGSTVTLDSGGNAALGDTDLEALNGGSGDWSGASLAVQRNGTAVSTDVLGFDTSGALFTVSGSNLQSGGSTFATFTNTGGVLTISFTSSGIAATTALVNDVAQRITYRSDTPAGDATVRFTLSDGVTSTTADVTVASDTIYVTNTTDTATINVSNGVSFSEAVAIAAADATGSQTLIFSSSFNSTMTLAGNLAINESLTINGDSASGLTFSGSTITLGGGTTLNFTNSTGTVTIASALAGTGSLSKAGAGTLALSSTSNESGMSGGISVTAGTLSISNDDHLSSGTLTLDGGTLTNSVSAFTIDNAIVLGAGGGTFNVGGGGGATTLTLSGVISGSGSLTKTAAAMLQLDGNNTYTGATNVSAGTLIANHNNALGTTAGATTVSSGATVRVAGGLSIGEAFTISGTGKTVSAVDYGALHLISGTSSLSGAISLAADSNVSAATGSTFTLSGALDGAFNLNKTDAGTLTLSNAGNSTTLSGGISVSAGTLSVASDNHLSSGGLTLASGTTLAVTGATTIDNGITLSGDATVSASANATLSGIISGANNLTKAGASTLTLSGSNTYSGTTTVSAGTLSVGSDSNLGSGALTLAGATTLAVTGATTIDNAIALAGNATVNTSANATLSGVVSGANNLTKAGASTLTLSASNTYSGTTTVSAGTLSVGSDSNLGSGALTLANGSTLAVTGATTIDNAVTLSGGAASVSTTANATLSGNITGAGGLTKTGASTLTLSGTDSYTGATSVNAGSLLVNGSLSATSAATVASGATLGGSGSISSNVTVNSGGTLSPGNSAGTLTVNGDLTMASGSTLAVEINGTTAGTQYDQVIVNGAVDVSGATLSTTHAYTPGSGDSYTIIVNDAADAVTGTFTGIAEGASFAAGGNSTQLTASYVGGTGNDFTLTAPNNPTVTSVTSISADGTYKIGDTVTVVVNFSEAVYLSTGTIQLTLETGTTDRVLSYLAGSGSATLYFSYTVQAGDTSADLDYTNTTALAANGDTIQGGSFIDANLTLPTPGAAGSLGANQDIVIDGVRPTASIVVADTALAVGETSTVTITFNEAVSGLSTADFTVANGALSGLSSGDGGITWTATLTPTASVEDTTNLIVLDNTGVQDAAGNTGTGTTDSNNYALDTLRPTASIVVADTALAAGETSTVTITFSEAVSGLGLGDFTVANGALSSLSSGDGGVTWTATLTPTASVEDTTNLIVLDNTGMQDAAGNAGTGTTDSNNYALDTLRPTASIVVADTALAVGETSTVTITFNEAVSGLTTADFTVANGALSGLSSGDGGITWTATLTPTASVEDSTNLIVMDNTGLQDAAGNAGTGTTDSNNYAIDTQRPTASIVVADTALAVGETSTVTITFNEAVSGLSTADFTVANGALSGLSSGDGGITWTATLTPTASVEDTTNLIVLDNTGLQDAAGNAGTGTTDSNNYAIDTLRPTASIVVADTALAVGETSTVTITFNEAVSGLTSADFTVANGALSGLSSGDGGITWTATLTPTASVEDTTNLIVLDNTGVQDAASNAGTGTTDSNNYAIDTLRPTASIVVADTALAVGETSTVTITFNEAVSGLTTADFTVANGALSGLSSGDGGITWTATLTPTASVEDSTNLIVLDNTGVQDAAGNVGTGSTNSNNYAIDNLRPTASIVVADTALAAGETSTVTITFNEAVSGLTSADFTVANGALSGLSTGDGGITWTATLTPTASVEDTTNLIVLDNTGVQDAAGNAGTGTTDSNNYAIDTLRPTATIVVADTFLTTGETTTVTITFNEAVSGLTTADFTVANGALSGLSSSDGGITWTATLTPATNINAASNTIALANTGVLDAAGNSGIGSTDSNNYAIDSADPQVSITLADSNPTNSTSVRYTLTFSEAVNNVDVGDFSLVTTGTASGVIQSVVQLDAQTYQVTVSGLSGAGSLALELVAGSDISDAPGNLVSGTVGPAYTRDVLGGDPEFRVTPTPPPIIVPPAPLPPTPLPPPPALLPPLVPPPLFEVPGLGGGLPPLGNIFLQNQVLAPSFLAQVFSSSSGDGSGAGFLGFGGGDAGVFGSSTLSSVFDGLVPQEGAVDIFGNDKDGTGEIEEEGFLGAPSLGQQLDMLRHSESQQIDQLARAFGEWSEKAPAA